MMNSDDPADHPPFDAVTALTATEPASGERRITVTVSDWLPQHEDVYARGELRAAAASYVLRALDGEIVAEAGGAIERLARGLWPWRFYDWEDSDRRDGLVRAVALLVAEIERIDRA